MKRDHAQPDPLSESVPDVSHVRSLMFVCLGNICRSPMAQGVFEHLAAQRGVRDQLTIASSGTGHWHIGDDPDHRTVRVCSERGVPLSSKGRQLARDDFDRFDLLLAMDRKNLADILRLGCPHARAALFMAFAPEDARRSCNLEVPDPYHGGPAEFQHVFTLVSAGAKGLLDAIFPQPSA
ncbi:MAG: low molecular weight phosphotyrosine protein phosphatase [Phycisphaerales bacterium]|nr:low molecular weight phosphotyrosine protein phosphatase [Phycisphaerales bacterium]